MPGKRSADGQRFDGYQGFKKPSGAKTFFVPQSKEEYMTANSKKMPQSMRGLDLNDSQTGSLIAQAINAARTAFLMSPVQSNAELIQRSGEYFQKATEREIPPTMEELGLYLGYTSATIKDWANGSNKGWKDQPYPGCQTSQIAKKLIETLHSIDAVLTESGKLNTVAYIFRSKNYYGMTDQHEVVITPNENPTDQLTPEEIAKRLPDLDPDCEIK